MGMAEGRTSAFSTSRVLSFARGPNLSTSAPLLSKLHTETRLFVTLCEPVWTRQRPTLKDGAKATVAAEDAEDTLGAGVDALLPLDDVPILYDLEI
jgi:hypothetical protein